MGKNNNDNDYQSVFDADYIKKIVTIALIFGAICIVIFVVLPFILYLIGLCLGKENYTVLKDAIFNGMVFVVSITGTVAGIISIILSINSTKLVTKRLDSIDEKIIRKEKLSDRNPRDLKDSDIHWNEGNSNES